MTGEAYEVGDEIGDLTGQKFGRWQVNHLSRVVEVGGKLYDKWQCCCSCGTCREVDGTNMRRGKSQSCGCSRSRR